MVLRQQGLVSLPWRTGNRALLEGKKEDSSKAETVNDTPWLIIKEPENLSNGAGNIEHFFPNIATSLVFPQPPNLYSTIQYIAKKCRQLKLSLALSLRNPCQTDIGEVSTLISLSGDVPDKLQKWQHKVIWKLFKKKLLMTTLFARCEGNIRIPTPLTKEVREKGINWYVVHTVVKFKDFNKRHIKQIAKILVCLQ